MTNSPAIHEESREPGISRRTVMKGVAWTVPAIAVASAVPTAAASGELPCINNIAPVGGTYPVSLSLSGCNTDNSHWDFNFKIRAALVDCDCERVRITMYDNPKRSRLWISNVRGQGGWNPSTYTQNSPQLYIQKELAPGAEATFPAQGDVVRRVDNGNSIGTITAHGTADDSLHALINPGGGALPCNATGPMATYKVECRKHDETEWTVLGENGIINPCVPMIQATVCRFDTSGNDRYRLGITVRNGCGIADSDFKITNIQRNNDTNFPNEGSSVWSGNQALSNSVTNIDMTSTGSGGQLWVSFTTDNGANVSTMRVPTNNNNSC